MEAFKYSVGNTKVGEDTAIVNLRANCHRVFCQLPDCSYCYDLRMRKFRPTINPYREKQEKQWNELNPAQYTDRLKGVVYLEQITFIRLQEGGDFKNQGDVDKLNEIANRLIGVARLYTYTARPDLNFTKRSENLVINGSGFMVDNEYRVVERLTGTTGAVCQASCLGCMLCKEKGGRTIECLLRHAGKGKKMPSFDFIKERGKA